MSNASIAITAAIEYRNLPLALLREWKTNPRRIFEETALKELADSICSQGVLSPLLVRPLNERGFEIVAGARRYRAAQLAGAETVPVRIVQLTDADALVAQLMENLQRRDVHPLEEAQGFRTLLNLEEPKYSIEQIAAKTGKSPSYVAQRLKLTELAPAVTEAFAKGEIGVGHALLLAKSQALCRTFQKRHLLSHKRGVIDEDYVQKATDPGAIVGRKVRVAKDEVECTIATIEAIGKRLFTGVLSANP